MYDDQLPPASAVPTPPSSQPGGSTVKKRFVTLFITTAVCFGASFLGAWAVIGSGIAGQLSQNGDGSPASKVVMQESEVVAEVAKKVSPSVVSIVTESYSATSLFADQKQEGAGTGIVISKNGYIMTNKHVVGEGTTRVAVIMSDGTRYDNVQVVGRDPLNDIAFLKVPNAKEFVPAQLGNSGSVAIGQKVIAIGNALGQYQNSVTSGIISGTGRPVLASEAGEESELSDLLQTDAAINPGNSGGPLVNVKGEVVGINTAIIENAQGIGFSIPINATKGLIKGVLKNGKVSRAYVGIQYVTLTPEVARELKLGIKYGAYVGNREGGRSVIPGSPAARAGIREEDIITAVNDAQIDENNSLATLLAQYEPGDKVALNVVRDGRAMKVEVTLAEYRG